MGTLGCSCSNTSKEEAVLNSHFSSDMEEVVEFQPDLYPKLNIINPDQLTNSKQSTVPTDNSIFDLQGELFRVQRSSKELLIPRWCVICNKTFKYYKNQYSAYCKEKPLFEIPVKSLLGGKAYKKCGRLYIELSFIRESVSIGIWNESLKATSEKGSKIESKNSSFSSVRLPKLNFASENLVDLLLFEVVDRMEWEKWSKGLSSVIKNKL